MSSQEALQQVSSLASEQGVPRVDLHKLLLDVGAVKTMMEKLAAKTEVQRDSNAWDSTSLKSWDVISEVSSLASEQGVPRVDLHKLLLDVGAVKTMMEKLAAKTQLEQTLVVSESKEELVEQLNQLKRDKDELAAQLADVQGSMQKNHTETANKILQMKSSKDVGYEQLSKQVSELKHTVAQLTDTTQAAVQDVAALKERMEEMQSMALQSMAKNQLRPAKDATIERLSVVTGTPDAADWPAVKDTVSAAMKDGPEQEHKRAKGAWQKKPSSPQRAGTALVQSPPKTIHAFDVFAHLQRVEPFIGSGHGNVNQWEVKVTLVCSSDASRLGGMVAPCIFRIDNDPRPKGEFRVEGREKLDQCVTRLLAKHTSAGGQQRWAYVARYRIDNLNYIHPQDLEKRKSPESCKDLDEYSVEWFQEWLKSSPGLAITNRVVRSPST